MGQGNYVALGFGVVNPPTPDEDRCCDLWTAWHSALKEAAGRRVHIDYESEVPYLALFVAENAEIDADAIKPQTCTLREACTGEAWLRAIEAWGRIQKASLEFGVTLPDGEPLLIADYD